MTDHAPLDPCRACRVGLPGCEARQRYSGLRCCSTCEHAPAPEPALVHGRDLDDPMGFVNAVEAVGLAVTLPPCLHCTIKTEEVHMGTNGWAVAIAHETECPENEDNQPADEVNITDWMNEHRERPA